MFVAMDKITDCGTVKAAQVTKIPNTVPKPQARDNFLIKTNDHVTFCDKCDILFRGVVKWIGTDEPTERIVVGIEVVRDNSTLSFKCILIIHLYCMLHIHLLKNLSI